MTLPDVTIIKYGDDLVLDAIYKLRVKLQDGKLLTFSEACRLLLYAERLSEIIEKENDKDDE